MTFADYLQLALERARKDEANGDDNGELKWINTHCRRGVQVNFDGITSTSFLGAYFYCVGGAQKDYDVHERYWDRQFDLFRQCDAKRIVADSVAIRSEWETSKCYLSPKMVAAMLDTAKKIVDFGWEEFRAKHLFLPKQPEAETPEAWSGTYWALRALKGVGPALSWYLIRNLFGGPFFKPDIHINAIAFHFFAHSEDPVEMMASEVRRLWPQVCCDKRLLPVHLGEVDYILWWYRRKTGTPEALVPLTADCR